MAEIAIGIAVALLQQAIPAAISKLKARFQQAKATEGETRELEDFLRCVQDCSAMYQNTCGGREKTKTTTRSFAKSLENVQKTLDRWSSQNSSFFSRSLSQRAEELRSLRRTLESAIQVEILRMLKDQKSMMDSILGHVRNNDVPGKATKRHPPPDDTKQPPKTQTDKERTKTTKSTDHARSNSTGRANTNPSKAPVLNRSRSKSVQRDPNHSSHRSEKRRTIDLWVSLDSEKQAKDVVNKLEGLEDVKKVFYDLVTKKVSVWLGEGSKLSTATLISEIQKAQSKDKVAPTLWLQRRR